MKRSRVPVLVTTAFVVLTIGYIAVPWERYPVFEESARKIRQSMAEPLFHLGQLPVSPAFILQAILFVLLLIFVARKSRRLLRVYVLDRLPIESGHKYALETALEYLIVIAGFAVGLQSAGMNLSSLAVIGGALGIGVGFGLQSIVNNFVSGLVLLFEGPIKVGDRVEIAQLNGDVVKIGARSTWVRTNDNIIVVMPNSEFIVKPVINWTATDRQVRFSLPVGVSYGSDPEQVRRLLVTAAVRHKDVLPEPAPDVIFTGFGDSSLDFELRFWTMTQVQTPLILKSDLYFAIFESFRVNSIEIPFPQRDVYLRAIPPELRVDAGPQSRAE